MTQKKKPNDPRNDTTIRTYELVLLDTLALHLSTTTHTLVYIYNDSTTATKY